MKTRAFAAAFLTAVLITACGEEAPDTYSPAAAGDPQTQQATAAQPESAKWRDIKALVRARFPQAPQLSVTDLAKTLEGRSPPPLLIDVREPQEYAVSHLPGAVNAQGRALERLVREAGKDRPIVLYCSVGYRSSREVENLRAQGFKNVSNLEGSIFEWANTGNPLVRGGPGSQTSTEAVHPFDDERGVLLDAERRSYTPR